MKEENLTNSISWRPMTEAPKDGTPIIIFWMDTPTRYGIALSYWRETTRFVWVQIDEDTQRREKRSAGEWIEEHIAGSAQCWMPCPFLSQQLLRYEPPDSLRPFCLPE